MELVRLFSFFGLIVRSVICVHHSVREIYVAEHLGKKLEKPVGDFVRPYSYIIEEKTVYPEVVKKSARRSDFDDNYDDNDSDEDDNEEEEEVDEDDDDDLRKNIHIHLKSLLNKDLLSYLIEQVPWDELLAPSRLTRYTMCTRYS